MAYLRAPLRLDRVPDFYSDVRTAEPRDRANARRRRHVDFGEIAVDDIEADEQQPTLAQRRADGRADFAFALRKFGRLSGSAANHVGAQIVGGRNAVNGTGEFAIDHVDALVITFDLGK